VTKFLITIVSMLALASLACGNQTLEGDVDHKTVSGVIEDTGWTILQNVPGTDPDIVNDRPSIRISDEEYQSFFAPEDEHAVITEEMERLLGQKYSNIRYTVNVRLADASGNDGTHPYYISRELFNRILVDSPVRYEASGEPIPTINKLLEPEG
jgi:hypothetical protein